MPPVDKGPSTSRHPVLLKESAFILRSGDMCMSLLPKSREPVG